LRFLATVVVALIKATRSGLWSSDSGVGTQINMTCD